VTAAKYDRSATQAERDRLRTNPPHIALTNYMMLEYLLVRPKDRDGIFANHRCRFLVLDEVHTYRGTLGTNIALLVRRPQAHLARAKQDWHTRFLGEDDPELLVPAKAGGEGLEWMLYDPSRLEPPIDDEDEEERRARRGPARHQARWCRQRSHGPE